MPATSRIFAARVIIACGSDQSTQRVREKRKLQIQFPAWLMLPLANIAVPHAKVEANGSGNRTENRCTWTRITAAAGARRQLCSIQARGQHDLSLRRRLLGPERHHHWYSRSR